MATDNGRYDSRWICWKCGDLDYLSNEGLCRQCKPERIVVEEFAVLAMRVICGERKKVERAWKIG